MSDVAPHTLGDLLGLSHSRQHLCLTHPRASASASGRVLFDGRHELSGQFACMRHPCQSPHLLPGHPDWAARRRGGSAACSCPTFRPGLKRILITSGRSAADAEFLLVSASLRLHSLLSYAGPELGPPLRIGKRGKTLTASRWESMAADRVWACGQWDGCPCR